MRRSSEKQQKHLGKTAEHKKEQTRELIIRTCEYVLDNPEIDRSSYHQIANASKKVDPTGKGRTAPTFQNDEYKDILMQYQMGYYTTLNVETNGMVDIQELYKLQKEVASLKRKMSIQENRLKEQLKTKVKEIDALEKKNEVLRHALQSNARLADILVENTPANVVKKGGF